MYMYTYIHIQFHLFVTWSIPPPPRHPLGVGSEKQGAHTAFVTWWVILSGHCYRSVCCLLEKLVMWWLSALYGVLNHGHLATTVPPINTPVDGCGGGLALTGPLTQPATIHGYLDRTVSGGSQSVSQSACQPVTCMLRFRTSRHY